MYTRVQTESVMLKFNQAKKLKISIPQNYPSLKRLEGLTVRLVYVKECLLLDLLVIDALVEVVMTYLGTDQQIHVLSEEFSLLHTAEKPQGEVSNFQVINTSMQSDYHCDFIGNEGERVREFDLIMLLRLVCQMSFARTVSERKGGKVSHHHPCLYRSREVQRNYTTRKNYPWKRG